MHARHRTRAAPGQPRAGPSTAKAPREATHPLCSPGQSLDPGTRMAMEGSFGHDFSHVRVHTDAAAADSARTRAAKAYTVGSDVVFGPGRYTPETPAGARLLAHELTHVVQQGQPHLGGSAVDAETEAARAADSAISGRQASVAMGGAGFQCDGEEQQIREQRRDRLRQQIAAIDAELFGLSGGPRLTQAQADERMITRARLNYELSQLQPASPEQAEAILNPAAVARRKQRDFENFTSMPAGLQQQLIQMGVSAPEKPAVFWSGGTLPSPELRVQVEAIARVADADNISLSAAARKVQTQPPKVSRRPTGKPQTPRQELNRQLVGGGLKPLPDPDRTLTEWERTEVESARAAGRSPWRSIHHPETGDIVGYERESGGFYQRRNTKGEITHQREAPMTEDATFLTKPERALTPFERQRVFVPDAVGSDPGRPRYTPVYSKTTGDIIGYTTKSGGITQTYNIDGVMVHEHELGLEPSPVQADDLLGLAAIGKAGVKYGLRKGAGWVLARQGGKEAVELGEKRLLVDALEKVGETEVRQTAKEGVVEAGESGFQRAAGSGVGKTVLGEADQIGRAATSFSPAPADVGEASFRARMTRDVEEVMRSNRRNTIGAGGEAAAKASARETAIDLNAIKTNFPQLDTVSRDTVASVKAFGVDKPLDDAVIRRYDRELRALRTPMEGGVPTKLSKAADLLAENRGAIQASGAWPTGLGKDASAEQIGKFVNKQGVLAIPSDHVADVRAAITAYARAHPEAYGLTSGPGLELGISRLTSRVQSLGLSSQEIMAINRRVWASP